MRCPDPLAEVVTGTGLNRAPVVLAVFLSLMSASGGLFCLAPEQRVGRPGDTVPLPGLSAAARAPGSVALQVGGEYKFSLDSRARLVNLGAGRSRFRSFRIRLTAGAVYLVEVGSLCNCSGYHKDIVVPVAHVRDPQQRSFIGRRLKYTQRKPGLAPRSTYSVWRLRAPVAGEYRVLVAADTSHRQAAPRFTDRGQTHSLAVGPTGRLWIRVRQIWPPTPVLP